MPMCEFQLNPVGLWARENLVLPNSTVKGIQLEMQTKVVGYHLNPLIEPVLLTMPKPLLSGIRHSL